MLSPTKRTKRNKIWNIPKEDLEKVVQNSSSLNAILTHFGFCNQSGVYKVLRARLKEDQIDISHISLGLNSNKGRNFISKTALPLSEILIENSSYTARGRLKTRLIREGVFEKKCYECGCLSIWNNKALTLQLDHINGINDDHRIENLRLLCPNCHSQTDTFSGRNKKKNNIFFDRLMVGRIALNNQIEVRFLSEEPVTNADQDYI